MLRLPKDVVAHPRHDEVVQLLASDLQPLWEGGRNKVATVPTSDALLSTLRNALRARQACLGLEAVAQRLVGEQQGLDAARARAPNTPHNARISRILFLASDGSPRFYRDCDALLSRYSQRLLACRLDVKGEVLGQALTAVPKNVRSVLIFDKTFGAQALLALLPQE